MKSVIPLFAALGMALAPGSANKAESFRPRLSLDPLEWFYDICVDRLGNLQDIEIGLERNFEQVPPESDLHPEIPRGHNTKTFLVDKKYSIVISTYDKSLCSMHAKYGNINASLNKLIDRFIQRKGERRHLHRAEQVTYSPFPYKTKGFITWTDKDPVKFGFGTYFKEKPGDMGYNLTVAIMPVR